MVSIHPGHRGQPVACHAARDPATELGHVTTRRQPMAVELVRDMPNSGNHASCRNAQVTSQVVIIIIIITKKQ